MSESLPPTKNRFPARLVLPSLTAGLTSLVPAALASLSLSISRGGFCWTVELLIVGIGLLGGLAVGLILKNLWATIIAAAIVGFFLPPFLLSFHADSPMWWAIVDFACW